MYKWDNFTGGSYDRFEPTLSTCTLGTHQNEQVEACNQLFLNIISMSAVHCIVLSEFHNFYCL